MNSNWNWGPPFNRIREEIDTLIWLVAEQNYAIREIIGERKVDSGASDEGTPDECE